MFVTQVGVSESRFVTVARLETIHETTGKDFPVSGDAKLRKDRQLLKARVEGIRASLREGLLDPPVPLSNTIRFYPNGYTSTTSSDGDWGLSEPQC